jgi:hypothetical protein
MVLEGCEGLKLLGRLETIGTSFNFSPFFSNEEAVSELHCITSRRYILLETIPRLLSLFKKV